MLKLSIDVSGEELVIIWRGNNRKLLNRNGFDKVIFMEDL